MWKKVLIANRGEIAVRIIRACREAGLQCVTVYSTADRNALHAEIADESVCIGPPSVQESYLNRNALIAACQNKQVPDTWNVGDSCMMAFGKKNYQIDIIGKNHDDYADGSGKAPLTFQMHTCYATEYKMNNSGSNTGGWADCLLRTTGGFKIIKSKMPAEVVAALKAVTKKTTAGGASSAIDTTEDTLFLLSEIEVQGTRTFSYPGEGTQYAYYKTAANRKKNRAWYLRSPRLNSTTCFDRTGWSGEADWSVASEVDGIAAAWCF